METKEYLEELDKLDHNSVHPEFYTYTTVWMKSRMPQAYKELKASFENYEGEIFDAMQQDEAPF